MLYEFSKGIEMPSIWSVRRSVLLTVLLLSVGVTGCNQESPDLTGEGGAELPIPTVGDDPFLNASASGSAESPESSTTDEEEPEEGDLRFSLKVGDRFPLRKTVEQTLVQQSSVGPVTSRSNLTLMFAITVDEEDEGRRRLGVRYQRVKYTHDILGEHIEFDSQTPPQHVPESLQVYNGLAGNSFSFWIGADNRIIEVIEFDAFLKRCVRFAPAHRQQDLLTQIVATQEDEGFANFVDESIGLLPYDPQATGRETAVRVGQQWNKTRKIMRPLPMELRTSYTLASLSDSRASVAILGTIEPMKVSQLGPIQQTSAQQSMALENGEIVGSCTIDRDSGLPLSSRVERRMMMTVSAPGQAPYEQKKTVVTTVESFPTHRTIFSRNEAQQASEGPVYRTEGIEQPGGVTNADFESDAAGQAPAAFPVR